MLGRTGFRSKCRMTHRPFSIFGQLLIVISKILNLEIKGGKDV